MYGRLDEKGGYTLEGGRDLDSPDVLEYCERRFLEACDIEGCGLGLRGVGDVTSGGRDAKLGLGGE